MQCGVSWHWAAVWRKRQHFERAFKSYNVDAVARFSDGYINDLMAWPDGTIIRNRSKLRAVVQNARVICRSSRVLTFLCFDQQLSACFTNCPGSHGTVARVADSDWSDSDCAAARALSSYVPKG